MDKKKLLITIRGMNGKIAVVVLYNPKLELLNNLYVGLM